MRQLKKIQYSELFSIKHLFFRMLLVFVHKFLLLFFSLKIAVSGFMFISFPTVAYAMPFACDGNIYQVQSGQLRIFDPLISAYVDVGAPNSGYNAVGFNIIDNFAYGAQDDSIIRIANDGSLTTLYTGNTNYNSFAGDVDDNNTLWLRNSATQYTGVDLSDGSTTTLTVTGQTTGSADIIATRNGGTPFLLAITGTRIARININTGAATRVNVSGLNPSGSYGASWADSTGRIFTFHNNTGQIFEITGAFGASPSGVLVAQGDPSNNNDGFSCDNAPFPNLPPLAMNDDFSSPFNNTITGNVLVDNGNGIDEDPEGFALAVTTTPITPPTNGSVTIQANGDFSYIPDNNFIGVDSFVYQITDPSGLTATATVTLTLTGTISFSVSKTQSGGPNPITAAGQVIDYEIEIQNTGDIPLSDIVVDDILPDSSSGIVTFDGGDTNSDTNLDLGETFLYSISYTVTQNDIDNNSTLINQASVTSTQTGATPVTSSASTPITSNPSLNVTKVATPRVNVAVGVSVTYTYTVINDGNVTLSNIDLNDIHQGSGTPPIPGNEALVTDTSPLGDSSDTAVNGIWDVLKPGDAVQFTANYVVTQQDVDAQ